MLLPFLDLLALNTASRSPGPKPGNLPPNEISALFEGVGFASVRSILRRFNTLKEIQAEIARYHANSLAYEAEVAAGIS